MSKGLTNAVTVTVVILVLYALWRNSPSLGNPFKDWKNPFKDWTAPNPFKGWLSPTDRISTGVSEFFDGDPTHVPGTGHTVAELAGFGYTTDQIIDMASLVS